MITKIDSFILECDNCQDLFEDGSGYTIFADKDSAIEKASDDDWSTNFHKGKHYCPLCIVPNPEGDPHVDMTRKDLHKPKPFPPKSQGIFDGSFDPKPFWGFVHNVIAHPLLVTGAKWADRFHDWTADKM